MKDGDRVKVINPDNRYFKETGIVVGHTKKDNLVKVFVKKEKQVCKFVERELEVISINEPA